MCEKKLISKHENKVWLYKKISGIIRSERTKMMQTNNPIGHNETKRIIKETQKQLGFFEKGILQTMTIEKEGCLTGWQVDIPGVWLP